MRNLRQFRAIFPAFATAQDSRFAHQFGPRLGSGGITFPRPRGKGEIVVDTIRGPVSHVVGPNGDVLTIADLPPPDIARWVPRRKAELVAAVCGGLISLNQACIRYRLTPEEFASWKNALDGTGMKGLMVTRPRDRRPAPSHDPAAHRDFPA
jgi:hypothetical protein